MHVSGFMQPASTVFHVKPTDTIARVLDLVVENPISAVVVTNEYGEPTGLVTKSNLVECYQKKIPVDTHVCEIMVKHSQLDTVLETDSRDDAAKMLEKCGRHHAIVVNAQGHYVGLISSFDVVSEVAKDSRAWPWMRTDDGKVHPAKETPAL
jgi:CBS domain-containing protein